MNKGEASQAMPGGRKCPQCGTALPASALDGLCPACLLKQGATPETAIQPVAAPFVAPAVDEVRRLFPQLEILGKGGMGAVYKARQPGLDRLVALKVLLSQTTIRTQPISGARDVVPGLTEIRVTFSKPMTDNAWSWSSAWPDSAPEILEGPRYELDERTCVVKTRLEPGRTYAYWLNSDKFQDFKDRKARAAVPFC